MAWCWFNATESKPQNVSGKQKDRTKMTELQEKIESFQNLLVDIATSGNRPEEEVNFKQLRTVLIGNNEIKDLLPDFVKTNRTVAQFWQFIKSKYSSYAERRAFLWTEFSKVLNYVETKQNGIIAKSATKTIEKFNQEYINLEWTKAMQRKADDPEGAITTARTLIETTCKFILDEFNETYKDDIELPKLYKLTAEKLNLAPDQHTEQVFKQILGGCQTVVEGLGALRNKLSDSHGKKTTQAKPTSRHAELAVNLAGTMTTFLLETYEFNTQKIKQ